MLQTLIALVLFLVPLAYSPGPGNMFIAANGARFGFRATIPANLGYHFATWIVTIVIGLGFSVVLDQVPQVFSALKLAGALYVFWIAWKLFRAGSLDSRESAKPATFTGGVILLALNPKAYVIIALMFTQFLNGTQSGRVMEVVFISTVFTLNNLVAFALWAYIGEKIAGYFTSSKSAHKLNALFGGVLAAVAVWMFFA